MSEQQTDQLEREIKELERDKKLEEIRQLKASGTIKWITPTLLVALLPFMAGFGIWLVGQLKEYNEGYRALQERDAIRAEKQELLKQKDSLNLEISTLIALKGEYADRLKSVQDQLRSVQEQGKARQAQTDTAYIRARFSTAEVNYALSHFDVMGPTPDRALLNGLTSAVGNLPKEISEQVREIVRRYEFAIDLVKASQESLVPADEALKLIPASDWAVKLQSMPTGAVIRDRKIMISYAGQGRSYFDVDADRFLSKEEVAKAGINR